MSANSASLKERKRSYYIKNRERILSQQREYYQRQRDRKLEYVRRYYTEHRAERNAYHKTWRRDHPEKESEYGRTRRDKYREEERKRHADYLTRHPDYGWMRRVRRIFGSAVADDKAALEMLTALRLIRRISGNSNLGSGR